MNETDAEQLAMVLEIARTVLGDNLIGVYLHGTTGAEALRPTSDLDVLVVIGQPTTEAERRALVLGLAEVSGSPEPRGRWRPVELTVVRQSMVNPWRYPPERELQFGQWERRRYLAGYVPAPEPDPDLAVLVSAALAADRPLLGPPAAAILAPVPAADLRRSVVAGVPGLLAGLEGDVRNVLLTLARIWFTLATGEIRSKDAAASWVLDHLKDLAPADRVATGAVLTLAREQYLAGTHGETAWDSGMPTAKAAARAIVDEIVRLSAERTRRRPSSRSTP